MPLLVDLATVVVGIYVVYLGTRYMRWLSENGDDLNDSANNAHWFAMLAVYLIGILTAGTGALELFGYLT